MSTADRSVLDGRLQLVPLSDFVQRPSMTWLIRRILPPQVITVVFGPPKGGKTFTTTDLLMHAAHGMDWHGYRVHRPLRVAFLAGEGRNGLRVRLHAWLEHHDSADLKGDFQVFPEALSLPDEVDDVIDMLRLYRPDVVAVDTLNAYFGPGDENATQDMTQFVGAVRRLRDEVECAVIVIHHTGLADGSRERGSGVLRGAADVVIQVGKDESGSGLVGFQVVTGRDIPSWEHALALRLSRVETDWLDDEDEPIVTCIVEAASAPVTLAGRGRKLSESQQLIAGIVSELAKAKTNGHSGHIVLLARTDIVDVALARGAKRSTAYRNIRDLATKMQGWHLIEPDGLEVSLV